MGFRKEKRIPKNKRSCEHNGQQRILALEVTDEKVHDSKMMKRLIKHVLNNNNTTRRNKLHSFISDGAYDNNSNFKFLKDCNITNN